MTTAPEPRRYNINMNIRDISETDMKQYAATQNMTITDLVNTALWYCFENQVDLAIWRINEVRKQQNQTVI